MELTEFSTTADLDYVSGVRRGWQRQIAFVKDADPLGPNYFVLADTFDAKSVPTLWRLFLAAKEITPIPMGVTMVGRDDVDLDIFFVRPATAKPQIFADRISVAVEASGTLTAILYPRLRTEKRPEVTPLADGQGIKIVTAAGTDIVYLNPEPIKAETAAGTFGGKVGLFKQRGGKPVQVLPGACAVARDWWPDGDPQLRRIHWKVGPQYPTFPDYEGAVIPNGEHTLVLDQALPATVAEFRVPPTGAPPKQATSVAVNWDDQALDVVFTCADTGIVAAIQDKDHIKLWKDDSVYVWLDPRHTHNGDKKYIMIQVSASGAWHDLRNGDPAFNVEGLKAEIARTGTGWSAHLQIPWKSLGEAAPKPGEVWGANFTRMDQPGKVDLDNMQMSSWVAIPFHPGDPTDLSRWGHLVFVAKGDAAAAETGQKSAAKTHQAIVDSAFTKDVLLKNP